MVEQPDADYRNNLISKPSTPPCKTESRTAAQSQTGTLQTWNSFQSILSQLQHQVLPTWRKDSDFFPGNPQIHSQPIKSLQGLKFSTPPSCFSGFLLWATPAVSTWQMHSKIWLVEVWKTQFREVLGKALTLGILTAAVSCPGTLWNYLFWPAPSLAAARIILYLGDYLIDNLKL